MFKKWDLEAAVISEVTDTGKMELFWHGELVGDMPIAPLSENSPVLDRPVKKPAYLDEIKELNLGGCGASKEGRSKIAF